jgi:hypothetical protein
MSDRIKIRAKRLEEGAGVEILVRHASRRRHRDAAASAPTSYEFFIEQMSFRLNEAIVAEVYTSTLISEIPLTIIEIDRATPGDVVNVEWHGAAGEFASDSVRFNTR